MDSAVLFETLLGRPSRDGLLLFKGDRLLRANAVGLRTFRAPGSRRGERWVPWLERQLGQFRHGRRECCRLHYQRPQTDRVLEYRVEFRRPQPGQDLTLVSCRLCRHLDLHHPLPPATVTCESQSLQLLLDSTRVGKLLLDQDGQILYANLGAAALFGRSPQALQNGYLGYPLELGQVFEMELPVGGEVRQVAMSVLPLPGTGAPTYLATLTDETERYRAQAAAEQAQAALRESEERFRLAMEQSAIGMCLLNPEGEFLKVNAALCRIMDRDEASLLAAGWRTITHPDDREISEAALRDLKRQPGGICQLRTRYLRPDGSLIWGDLSVACIRERSGKIRCFIAQIVDVTDLVEGQAALARREAEYRQLVSHYQMLAEHASDLICLVDPSGQLTWISPSVEHLLGWAPGDLLGQPLSRLFRPPSGGHGPEPTLVQCRQRSGNWHWMAASGQPVSDHTGLRGEMVWTLRDVNELVWARARAEAAEARLRAAWDVQLDPHVVYEAVRSPDGTLEDLVLSHVNAAACADMRRSAEQLLGARLGVLLPGLAETGLFADYAAVIHSGEPLILNDFTYDNELVQDCRRYDIRAVRLGDGLSVTWRDVTERYRMMRQLADSEEQFRLLAENATSVVLHLRRERVVWVSPSLEQELGWKPAEWIGRRLSPMIHPDDLPCYNQTLAAIRHRPSVVSRGRLRGRDGRFHWVEAHCRIYRNAQGQPDGLVASFRTVDDLVAAEAALRQRARIDPLTGLLNRAEVFARMQAIAAHPRRSGQHTALLFCDLDHFKPVNDHHGHAAGDALLRTVAERLQQSVRAQDLVARIGGDELLVVLVGVQDIDNAVAIAETLCGAVSAPVLWEATRLQVSLSVGVTLLAADDSIDQLVARADAAMYQAKLQGRNRVVPLPQEAFAAAPEPQAIGPGAASPIR